MTKFSEAAKRVRKCIKRGLRLVRDDVAELLEDYDALADTYERVMTGKPPAGQEH
jgi:hypothetical protein